MTRLHPETKNGGDTKKRKKIKDFNQNANLTIWESYAKDAARKTGLSQASIYRYCDLAKRLLSKHTQNANSLTDLERAARFLYLQRLTFGGKVKGLSFGADTHNGGRFNIMKLEPLLEVTHERLSGVWIECLPWQNFIEKWDRPHSLFYCDPPYYGVEDYYGKCMFARAEFEDLSARLRDIKGRFILSINDTPEIREIFK
jgi:site-specific DNA-adenine methylase